MEGRKVLFSGTPCQIAGLHHFLRKPYDNLLSVDIICHDTPNPKVWGMYLDEVVTAGRKAINDVQFRKKRNGWKAFNFTIEYNKDEQSISLCSHHQQNHFMRAFLRDMILRPSCHNCQAKQCRSMSDITIADCWGIQVYHPEMDDDKGTGLVLIHTQKGQEIFENLQVRTLETNYDEVTSFNPAIVRSAKEHPCRDKFLAELDETQNLSQLILECTKPSRKQQIRTLLSLPKRVVRKILKTVMGGKCKKAANQ